MNKLIAIIAIGLCFSPLVSAKTLNQSLNDISKQQIKSLSSPDDKYSLKTKNTIKLDLNKDGVQDYAVLMSYCEATNCHTTTEFHNVLVFLGQKDGGVKLLKTIQVQGLQAKIEKLPNNVIQITSYSYKDNDPTCCPTKKSIKKIRYVNGKILES